MGKMGASRRTEFILCRWLQSYHFIVLMELSAFVAILSGYAIAVGTDAVNPVFPYISDTGTTPPSSCVFGLLLSISAGFGVGVIFIQHRHLESKITHQGVHALNDVAMLAGLLTCLGMIMVASFQWTVAGVPHIVGSAMVYLFGGMYCCCQSVLSIKRVGPPASRCVILLRVALSFVVLAGWAMALLFMMLANAEATDAASYNGTTFGWNQKLHWISTYPGYAQHLVSVFSEWSSSFALLLFFATYYKDFKNLNTKMHVSEKNEEATTNSFSFIS